MENFTGIKNGTVFENGKPVVETSSKYATYSKQGSTKKESNTVNEIVKKQRKQQKEGE